MTGMQSARLEDDGCLARKVIHHLGADDRSSTRVRIVDATLACLSRQGLGKTTLDDIARES
jgi:AcrR family transcriptional regulator